MGKTLESYYYSFCGRDTVRNCSHMFWVFISQDGSTDNSSRQNGQ